MGGYYPHFQFKRRHPSHTIETTIPSDDIVQSQPAPTSQTEPPSDIVVQSQLVPTIQTESPSDIVVQSQPAPTIQTSTPSRNKSMVSLHSHLEILRTNTSIGHGFELNI